MANNNVVEVACIASCRLLVSVSEIHLSKYNNTYINAQKNCLDIRLVLNADEQFINSSQFANCRGKDS